jgi:MFS transporter, DHA2 family, multidrug resistance protein
MNLVSMFAIVGFAIITTQYLQSVLGMEPFTAALRSLVPMTGTMAAAPSTQVLVQRVDRAYIAAGGSASATDPAMPSRRQSGLAT